MNEKVRERILHELNIRISDAHNIDNSDEAFALENFLEWFIETYYR